MLTGYARERTALGRAAETYRLTAPGLPTRYLKLAASLSGERDRLRWAIEHLPVPRVIDFGHEAGRDWLLLEELPGTPVELATTVSIGDRVTELAHLLRTIHAVPIAACPFDARIAVRLIDAERAVQAGTVDTHDFDADRAGRTADSVLAELRAWSPFAEDLVVTHGDYTLSNVLLDPRGVLDLGRLGVADRYQDLALVMRDIAGDYGESWVAVFAAAYGLDRIDDDKRAFFALLDELA